jgi:hypothetical protein
MCCCPASQRLVESTAGRGVQDFKFFFRMVPQCAAGTAPHLPGRAALLTLLALLAPAPSWSLQHGPNFAPAQLLASGEGLVMRDWVGQRCHWHAVLSCPPSTMELPSSKDSSSSCMHIACDQDSVVAAPLLWLTSRWMPCRTWSSSMMGAWVGAHGCWSTLGTPRCYRPSNSNRCPSRCPRRSGTCSKRSCAQARPPGLSRRRDQVIHPSLTCCFHFYALISQNTSGHTIVCALCSVQPALHFHLNHDACRSSFSVSEWVKANKAKQPQAVVCPSPRHGACVCTPNTCAGRWQLAMSVGTASLTLLVSPAPASYSCSAVEPGLDRCDANPTTHPVPLF